MQLKWCTVKHSISHIKTEGFDKKQIISQHTLMTLVKLNDMEDLYSTLLALDYCFVPFCSFCQSATLKTQCVTHTELTACLPSRLSHGHVCFLFDKSKQAFMLSCLITIHCISISFVQLVWCHYCILYYSSLLYILLNL